MRIPEMKILYQDEDMCIIDKPPKVFVHYNRLEPETPNCVDELRAILGTEVYNVHRIDRATSGAVIFALNKENAAELSRQFRDGDVEKHYIAVVRGHLDEDIEIKRPVRRSKKGPRVDAHSRVRSLALSVIPEALGPFDEIWYSLVEVELFTGRYHQARSHLRSVDHPVLGDTTHGDGTQNAYLRDNFGIGDLLLRAYRICLDHPQTGERIECISGFPEWWLEALTATRLSGCDDLVIEPSIRTVPSSES